MKTLLCTLILATIGTTVAKADSVTITLDQPNQIAVPGGTLQFFGTITNDTGTTIYLNGDALNLDGLSFTTVDQFFNTVPISLAPSGQVGDSSGDIELFDVNVSDPLIDALGTYSGSYTLVGGADGGAGTAQDNLGSVSFSVSEVSEVSEVPEPSTIYLLLGGLSGALVPISRRLRGRVS